jgi:hypothetical protein
VNPYPTVLDLAKRVTAIERELRQHWHCHAEIMAKLPQSERERVERHVWGGA